MTVLRARIGFPDYSAEPTWTDGDGSWLAAYPITNVQNDRMARVARSTDATTTNTQATATFPSKRPIQLVALLFDNPSPRLQVRVEVIDSDDNVKHDSGWIDAFPRAFDSLDLEWSSDSFWSGRPTKTDLAGRRHMIPIDLGQPFSAKKIKVYIDDNANADGFISVSYIFLGGLFEFEHMPTYGATFGFLDLARVERARGGALDIDEPALPRQWGGEIRNLSRAEVFRRFHEQQRFSGRKKVFPVIPEPAQPIDSLRLNFMARNAELNALSYDNFKQYGMSVLYEEAL